MLHTKPYLNSPEKDWVVFIHGAGGSSSIWFKQIKAYSEEFNVLLVDLRGHGKVERYEHHEKVLQGEIHL
jgi:pimeloyl-ACP methyl ester carboxylesterase